MLQLEKGITLLVEGFNNLPVELRFVENSARFSLRLLEITCRILGLEIPESSKGLAGSILCI